MEQLRVWRVTVKSHSAVFNDVEVASQFVRGGFTSGEWTSEDKIVMESEWMSEEEYLREVEREDGVKVEVKTI